MRRWDGSGTCTITPACTKAEYEAFDVSKVREDIAGGNEINNICGEPVTHAPAQRQGSAASDAFMYSDERVVRELSKCRETARASATSSPTTSTLKEEN